MYVYVLVHADQWWEESSRWTSLQCMSTPTTPGQTIRHKHTRFVTKTNTYTYRYR